ncbi:MAG TPA: hypothetical protein VNH11_23725 [Pirellulales bacterium]|nr:hypothetical protein [Pirellulales bacterium]
MHNHDGLTNADLRLMINEGLVEHRVEITRNGARKRTFRRAGAMNPAARTCFVLSAAGLRYALRVCNLLQRPTDGAEQKPHWDAASRDLTLGGMLVKHLPEIAETQQAIVDACVAAEWKNPIDNPFADMPPSERSHYLRRLLDHLNHGQKDARIHFSSAAKGRQFRWSFPKPPQR